MVVDTATPGREAEAVERRRESGAGEAGGDLELTTVLGLVAAGLVGPVGDLLGAPLADLVLAGGRGDDGGGAELGRLGGCYDGGRRRAGRAGGARGDAGGG